jgi:uncharacterized delta-60 repeat protein
LNWTRETNEDIFEESINGRFASDLEEKLVKTNMRQLAGRKLRRLFRSAGLARLGLAVLAGSALSAAQAQPANDNFANAIDLTAYGDTGSTTGTNVGATIQSGEQNIGAFASYAVHSVWYQWTASTSETMEFDPNGSLFGTNLTIVQVFTNSGSGISSLKWVAYGYYGYLDGFHYNYTNSFQAVAGQTYYVSVAGYDYPSAAGSFQLNWSSSRPPPPPPNDNFASATVLTGVWGSTNVDNSSATHEAGEPSHAGYSPNKSVWYQWTAPQDGEVTLDTVGSGVDTVLAVYTGASLASLNQVAANDDLFPVNSTLPDVDTSDPAANETWDIISGGVTLFGYFQDYYGPSGLRFNARAGTTYYFAVDAKSSGGSISLNWAYKSSGVFRWATEDVDPYAYSTSSAYMPVYKTSDTESVTPSGLNNSSLSVVSTYYNYNAPGALVTVTRTAGSSGRALVDYTTVDGDNLPSGYSISSYDMAAYAGANYTSVSGTLVFDDFEMSKTILIPIIGSSDTSHNSEFGVVLSNPQLDPYESGGVSPPRVDPAFNVALVKILNTDADPNGPDYIQQVSTNGFANPPTNSIPNLVTNMVLALYPTNSVVNFEKANYRVPADVNGTNSPWAQVTLWVERFPTNYGAQTINYRVNNFLEDNQGADDEYNAFFPLQPGSDYAVPTPPTNNVFRGRNSDFNLANSGTLTFPASPVVGYNRQPLTFTVPVSSLTKFNKDFKIQLNYENKNTVYLPGMNSETTVTILFDDMNPPAGSVDELYNADFNGGLALPPQLVPQTWPANNLNNPGVSGQVYGLAVLPNDETIIAGNFSSYNGVGRNNLALLNKDGSMDTSFNPGDSANAAVNALVVSGSQFVIGGAFTAYNDTGVGYFARVNADGLLDAAFSTSQGSGADAPVRAVAVQSDGKVVIGGDFTHVDGVVRNYLARLNADGSLDTTFDPGSTLNGSVYTLASVVPIKFSAAGAGTNEADNAISLGAYTSGTLTAKFNFGITNNDMRIFYGNTNVAAGTGVLIYDTGNTNGAGNIALPFGPVGGLTASQITIVMNQGGNTNGPGSWSYSGTIALNSGIIAGGQFNVAGQIYGNIARFTTNGVLDTTFNPGTGPDNKVLALAWQPNDQIIAGGVFTHVNGASYNRIVRFNPGGSIDTTNFFVGTGADDVVYNITLQPAIGAIYVGGQFSSFNGTHRLGFTRLYSNGTVDTTFMDTAYNQFAGLKKIYSYDLPGVYASDVQSDGNVMIGGSFNQVGGGQADPNICNTLDDELFIPESFDPILSPSLWVEPKTRDGVRNRNSIARLIGGSTPGPGNLGLQQTSSSANKSQSSLSVGLVRTNGNLGPVSANFSVLSGAARSGSDYSYFGTPPMFWIDWIYRANPNQSRMHGDGLSGNSGFLVDPYGLNLTTATKEKALNKLSLVTVSIIKNTQSSGDLNAQFQLANPAQADQFYLGGENIPLGAALGVSSAALTIVDDSQKPGVFGFSSTNFIATSTSAPISVLRSNGVAGSITVRYSTISSNSTAVVGVDYVGLTNAGPLVYNQGVVSNGFNVTILNHGIIYTNMVEKTVALRLSQLSGGTYGISNTILRLINPNYKGYLTLTATNYNSNESSGSIAFVVNRVAGSLGSVSVQYATTDGPSATNGVDYTGSTGTLSWNSGDVSQRIISVPLIQTGTVGANRRFGVSLFNPMVGISNAPSLMGSISNASLTIINDNSSGTLQFSAPSYLVNENGGYATITVVRTGGSVGTISAHYATSDGTALADVDHAGVTNYIATSGAVTLGPGQVAASFTVPIVNDGVVDPSPTNFYFNVSLVGPGISASAAVQIVDAETYNRLPGSPDTGFNAAGINGSVFTLALQPGGQILAGGNFTAVGTTPEGSFARLNPDGSLDTTFLSGLAGANGSVQSIVCQTDGRILLGGSFGSVNGDFRHFIARVMADGSQDTSFNPGPGADNVVNAVAETFAGTNREIYVAGAFGNISGSPSPGIARLNNDGSFDGLFSVGSGADGAVSAIAVYPTNSFYAGKVVIGGAFTHFNGMPLNGLARLNADGSLDTNFNAGFGAGTGGGAVRALAVQLDGCVLVGGSFTRFNGLPVNNIVRLNTDGTVDTNFVGGASDSVEGIALQADNRIILVGQFTQANGITRNHITRLLPTGATDPTINFGDGANGDVDTVVVQPADGMIVIGGNFSQYDDLPHAGIARIYGGSVTGSGQFEFTSANYQALETGGFAQITIRRTGGTSGANADGSGDVFINFATTTGTAVANVNYTPVNENVDFPAGEVLRTVMVPVMDDFVITPDLTVTNVLSNPTPVGGLGNQLSCVLTIVNTDTATTLSNHTFGVAFLNSTNYVSETSSPGLIFVQRIGNPASGFQVNYATTDGTALAGINYTATAGTLSFVGGEVLKTISVPLINNQMTTNLTFGMSLSSPTAGALLVAPSNALIVLQPGAAGLSFTSPATSVSKNVGTAVIPVVCSNPGVEPLSVQYYTLDGTALNGQDYTGVSGTLVFTNGIGTNNVRVPISNNSLITGSRTFTVVLTNATAPGKITSPSNQVVTIIDSNSGLSFSSPVYTVNRTNVYVTITVIRTDNTNQVSTVNYATADGTAVAPTDYIATNGTCVFTNGVTSQTFTVTVIARNTVQPEKTVLLQLSNPTGGFLAPPSAAVLTIHDTSGSLVVPAGSAFAPNGDPNHNGLIDPNETVTLLFAFRAAGGNNVTNLYATLLATSGVTAPSPATPVSYGQLNVGGPSASRAFSFTANGSNSQQIAATFLLTNGTTSLGTALFTYILGTWTTVFSNTSPIVINAAGPASPYPSTITVSNVGGVLLNTVITLTNISHTAPAAINTLLVSPNQNDTLFMSHAGGGQFGGAISGVTLTFEDATHTNSLPFNGQITNGIYNSTQYGGAPVFP